MGADYWSYARIKIKDAQNSPFSWRWRRFVLVLCESDMMSISAMMRFLLIRPLVVFSLCHCRAVVQSVKRRAWLSATHGQGYRGIRRRNWRNVEYTWCLQGKLCYCVSISFVSVADYPFHAFYWISSFVRLLWFMYFYGNFLEILRWFNRLFFYLPICLLYMFFCTYHPYCFLIQEWSDSSLEIRRRFFLFFSFRGHSPSKQRQDSSGRAADRKVNSGN